MKQNWHKKILASILTIVMVSAFILPARRAHATIPVTDVGNLGTIVGNLVTNSTGTAQSISDIIKEFALDTVAYTLATTLATNMASQVINYVNSGLSGDGWDGDAFFPQSQSTFLEDISDLEVVKMFENLKTDFTNLEGEAQNLFAFGENFGKGLIDSYTATTAEDLISTVDPEKLKDFGDDFSVGGHKLWNESLKPQNNPFGFDLLARSTIGDKIANKTKEGVQELEQNEGFQSAKECVGAEVDLASASTNELVSLGFNVVNNGSQFTDCIGQVATTTVGSLISDTTKRALGTHGEATSNADEISEVIGAALGNLMTSYINKGFAKLGSSSSQTQQHYGGPEDTGNTQGVGGLVDWLNAPYQIVDLEAELPVVRADTEVEVTMLEEMRDRLRGMPDKVSALDACVPGPKIGWQERLEDYFNRRSRKTQKKANKSKDKAEDVAVDLDKLQVKLHDAILFTKDKLIDSSTNVPKSIEMRDQIAQL